MNYSTSWRLLSLAVAVTLATMANATPIYVTGYFSGDYVYTVPGTVPPVKIVTTDLNLAAKATFDFDVAGKLKLTLENTSTFDVVKPAEVLTAVFFAINGSPLLTPISATLGAGSTIWFNNNDAQQGDNVGGEWAYVPDFLYGFDGVSSTGLNYFGAANFYGINLGGPEAVNGVSYGITSLGDNPSTGNAKVTGGAALIHNSVDFLLATPAGFSGSTLKYTDIFVYFQYGTDWSEPGFGGSGGGGGGQNPDPVPDGGNMVGLLGLVLLGFGVIQRSRRK